MTLIASFTAHDQVWVEGLGQRFLANVSAIYSDGSACILRDLNGRIAIARSNPHLNAWTIGRHPVELQHVEPEGFDALMSKAWAALEKRGLRRPSKT